CLFSFPTRRSSVLVPYFLIGFKTLISDSRAQSPYLLECHIPDHAAAVSLLLYIFIMDDHEMTVRCHVHINLQTIHSCLKGFLKSQHRIFRMGAHGHSVRVYFSHLPSHST